MKLIIVLCMLLIPTISQGAQEAERAVFTGEYEVIVTGVYQMGWKCQYEYEGTKAWYTNKTFCPITVDMQ